MNKRWAFEAAVFVGLWLLLGGWAPAKLFRDPGTFWHTAIGRQFLETGQLPQVDGFSYTRAGQPWVSQSWLCEIALAGLYRIGGWDSLLVVTVTLGAATFAWLAGRLGVSGLSGLFSVLLATVALAASAGQFHVRPSTLTLTLTAVVFAWLVDVERGQRPLRQLWWLVPLLVLWTNLHGGVLGGLGTLGLVAVGWLVWGGIRRAGPVVSRRDALELLALLLACGLSVFANPYGGKLPALWLAILDLPLAEFIQEHGRLTRSPGALLPSIALAAVYAACWWSVPWRQWRVTWLMPPVWFVLAWSHSRHAPLFAVVTLLALADLLPASGVARLLARRGWFRVAAGSPPNVPTQLGWRRAVVPLVVVLLGLVLPASGVALPLVGRGWVRLDATYWPLELEPELQQLAARQPEETRLFNDMRWGGYLIFHEPRVRVFIDDRCELYGEAFLRRYARLCWEEPAEFDRWDAELHFTHALVESGSAIDDYLQRRSCWEVLRSTPCAKLYRRVAAGGAAETSSGVGNQDVSAGTVRVGAIALDRDAIDDAALEKVLAEPTIPVAGIRWRHH